ncbi:MAG: FIST C-terminal domain-containing protein [Magnetococcales bacterium]|nr:FIST C-terminal domain-containing protein [Magnetococcales bacterium]MBF0322974.1 FIST C-terminal domain-containing protein [Magnetococcales bacterium]
MKWGSSVKEATSLADAMGLAILDIREQLDQQTPDLALVFVSSLYQAASKNVPELLQNGLQPRHWIGCSAHGVIGGGHEVEFRPAVSITAAVLPDVRLRVFHMEYPDLGTLGWDSGNWQELTGTLSDQPAQFLLLADPFSFNADHCMRQMDIIYPGAPKVGGMASGGTGPGGNLLWTDGRLDHSGLTGIALQGNIRIDTVVTQGCRPIGNPMFVTRQRENILQELDGRRPDEILAELIKESAEKDQHLVHGALFLGLAMVPAQVTYRPGDFLIRNLMGLNPESGALTVGGVLEPFQVVQFHVRDAKSSREDLIRLLREYQQREPISPKGSVVFSCLGRGSNLFGRADHDTDLFRQFLGNVPLGGFFGNGEIGPVAGKTFLHGYTSSFGLFHPRRSK